MEPSDADVANGAAEVGCLSIAHVHTGLVGSGGDRVSELEAQYLAKVGCRVTIVGNTEAPIAARLLADGVNIVGGDLAERKVEPVLARTGRLDIVHCHCILSAPFAAALARESGAALVVHVHSMGEGWWECTGFFSSLNSKRRRLRSQIDEAISSAKLVLCVSETVREHMKAIRLPVGRVEIMPNPIDDLFFRREIAEGPVYDVAILARPSRAKSPLIALRILAEARRIRPGLRMLWIGPLGRWAPILEIAARLHGLGNLYFAGSLPPERVCDLLDRTRVLLSASHREGQPLSVLEALARRCSALLSDIPSHRPFAVHPAVRLFPLRRPDEAARILVQLLGAQDPPRGEFFAGHRLEAHGRRLLRRYQSVVGGSDVLERP